MRSYDLFWGLSSSLALENPHGNSESTNTPDYCLLFQAPELYPAKLSPQQLFGDDTQTKLLMPSGLFPSLGRQHLPALLIMETHIHCSGELKTCYSSSVKLLAQIPEVLRDKTS